MVRLSVGIRVIVSDILIIFCADFRIIQVVDKFLRQLFIFRAFRDGKGVGPDDRAFFGDHKSNVLIILMSERGIAAPHGTDPGFFRNKFLLDGIRIIG